MTTVSFRSSYVLMLAVMLLPLVLTCPILGDDEKLVVAPPADGVATCNVVFCQTDTRKCLVFDEKGKWMRSVRLLQIAMRYPDKAYVALKMYDGIYEPSNPRVEKRFVDNIKSVTVAEFQKMIDDLNKGGAIEAVGTGVATPKTDE